MKRLVLGILIITLTLGISGCGGLSPEALKLQKKQQEENRKISFIKSYEKRYPIIRAFNTNDFKNVIQILRKDIEKNRMDDNIRPTGKKGLLNPTTKYYQYTINSSNNCSKKYNLDNPSASDNYIRGVELNSYNKFCRQVNRGGGNCKVMDSIEDLYKQSLNRCLENRLTLVYYPIPISDSSNSIYIATQEHNLATKKLESEEFLVLVRMNNKIYLVKLSKKHHLKSFKFNETKSLKINNDVKYKVYSIISKL